MRDASGSLTTSGAQDEKKTWLQQRFAGSSAEVTTYVGSGSFYTSGYRDPYVSNAFYVRPQYNLGTRFQLHLAGRIYVEEEYTTPDLPNGRRFNPLDSIIYLNAKNLYTMPKAKVKFFGGVRASIPVSYESRYSHLVTSLGISAGATRMWEFGRPDAQGKRWNFVATFGEGFSKAIRTSDLRGNFPGDTTGCRTTGPAGYTGGPGAAENDRCGGPLNTSYGITTSGGLALTRGRYSLSMSLIVLNEFKYGLDADTYYQLAMMNLSTAGRTDITWGIISAGYDITDHFSLSVGLASYQPALDSRYQNVRFPFFDFSGANANNFTQVLVGVSGTL
ncbi:MAG TPA: hypothetical protein VHL80_10150 [Polyangia bacterium]|nr:hypothetical protein [Polyangia bacterium]